MENFPTLNLPAAHLRTKQDDGHLSVFDELRRRYVSLTPEEWVRQHFVQFLITHRSYPTACVGNEVSLTVEGMKKRCDTVIYGQDAHPLAIVEYKAANVPITQRVFDQTWRYNMPLRVPYIIISNGMQHFCCRINYETSTTVFMADIPTYEEMKAMR